MSPEALQAYLHTHIPLSRAMGVTVVSASVDRVTLSAPLAPNINHRETVFGGSAAAVALLAGWSLIYLRLQQARLESRVVVQRETMHYERPIAGDFSATCALEDPRAWQRFVQTLQRKGRARVTINAQLHFGNERAGELEGDFVALRPQT